MMAFLLLHWRALGALVVAIALAVYIGALKLEVEVAENARDKAVNEKVAFVNQVKADGEKAKVDAERQQLQDQRKKEQADAENVRKHAADQRTITQLRLDAANRDTGGGSMPPAPAGSKCPEGQACFDRAEYQRALGDFDREARSGADEGTAVTTDLDTAKRWAQ